MARTIITEREVNMLRSVSRRSGRTIYLWDTELRGFGLRVSANGRGTWLVRKWVGGRRGKAERIIIGHHPPMTVAEARNTARGGLPRGIEQVRNGKLSVVVSRSTAHADQWK